jgi:hypothetical protein
MTTIYPNTQKEIKSNDRPFHPLLKMQAYNWLETLRESGEVNMFFIRRDLQDEFDLTKARASELLGLYHDGSLEEDYNAIYKTKR